VIVSREVLLTLGTYIVDHVVGKVHIQPHWTGKVATGLQIGTVATSMLRLPEYLPWVAVPAAAFTAVSAVIYFTAGTRQALASPGRNAPRSNT
jgi:CDP-diacylglycerol--glycerol-3-phosphate 3-phosphatidyltransferase/cardiolipin synthase